jgi:hypothetical protein
MNSSLPEKKPAVKSTTIWGSLLGSLPLVYLLERMLDLPDGMLDETVAAGAGFLGLLLQVYGRLRAGAAISGLFRVRD